VTEAPSPAAPGDLIAVGRVARAHGVHGEVAILPLSEVETRFEPGSQLLVGEDGERALIVAARRTHRSRPLVRFAGIDDRTTAEDLVGQYLFVPASATPALPEGSFWPHQLAGAHVVTVDGVALGRLREVIHTAANDVWVVEGPGGDEVLVPALRDVVLSVDVEGGRIVVAAVPGLTVPDRA
jgi:16S rRNA processing protein RimM